MTTKKLQNPYGKYNFLVEIDGLTSAGFKDVSGLDNETDVGTYREGADPTLGLRKFAGLVKYSNITLTRGVTSNHELWDWRQKIAKGIEDRRNISIILCNDIGEPQIQWDLRAAWPCKWSGPAFDATASEITVETLEIVHEGLSVQKW